MSLSEQVNPTCKVENLGNEIGLCGGQTVTGPSHQMEQKANYSMAQERDKEISFLRIPTLYTVCSYLLLGGEYTWLVVFVCLFIHWQKQSKATPVCISAVENRGVVKLDSGYPAPSEKSIQGQPPTGFQDIMSPLSLLTG